MLRVVSTIYLESQALESLASTRRDVYKLLRIKRFSSTATSAAPAQTVLAADERRAEAPPPPPPPGAPPPPPAGGSRRTWAATAAALALTASLGGAYLLRSRGAERPAPPPEAASSPPAPEPYPSAGELFPPRVDFLLIGGGTASFAAMRALRAARPDASVLIVGDESLPPYMRPPLSKEAWREEALAAAPDEPLAFRQWNGRRRPLLYEPLAFYAPVESLARGAGAAAARGWTATRVDVPRHEATLEAPGRAPVTLSYGRCLVAPGLRARRLPELSAAREAGRAFAVRDVRDAARLARAVDAADARRVVVVGGGLLAGELSAALARRVAARGARVTLLCREEAPLARALPPYLAAEAARRLREAGVDVRGGAEVRAAEVSAGAVALRLSDGAELRADVVVECVGAAADEALARASGLEAAGGALLVNAELQARADVWGAGDAVSWPDAALGRRRATHHDHAVHSGRRAGENMAAPHAQRPYDHQPMFWSDLGAELGFEAVGLVDSSLATVGVFSEADVADAAEARAAAPDAAAAPSAERRYARGVVFYTRERRVVGVLLWNLFNRMHVARQVLAQGHFDDLLEVAKLFSLHEDD